MPLPVTRATSRHSSGHWPCSFRRHLSSPASSASCQVVRASRRKGEGGRPHFFSSDCRKPVRCHSATVSPSSRSSGRPASSLRDGHRPGQHEARRQGDAEALPFAAFELMQQEDLVVDPADAMLVAKGLAGLAGAVERRHVEQQPLLRQPVPERALKAADREAAQVRPGADLGVLPQQHVGAVAVVLRLDHGDELAPAAGVAHRGGDDVDLAPLHLLQAVGAADRLPAGGPRRSPRRIRAPRPRRSPPAHPRRRGSRRARSPPSRPRSRGRARGSPAAGRRAPARPSPPRRRARARAAGATDGRCRFSMPRPPGALRTRPWGEGRAGRGCPCGESTRWQIARRDTLLHHSPWRGGRAGHGSPPNAPRPRRASAVGDRPVSHRRNPGWRRRRGE